MASSKLSSNRSYGSITDVSDEDESKADYREVHLKPKMPDQDEPLAVPGRSAVFHFEEDRDGIGNEILEARSEGRIAVDDWWSQNGNYLSVSILLKENELTSIELYDNTKYYAKDPRLKDDHFLN